MMISGLLDLANAYCEEALKRDCERIIRHGITTENAAMLYAVAIKYEATVSSRIIEGIRTECLLAPLFGVHSSDICKLCETCSPNFLMYSMCRGIVLNK